VRQPNRFREYADEALRAIVNRRDRAPQRTASELFACASAQRMARMRRMTSPHVDEARLRVLVVEDDVDQRESLVAQLEAMDCRIVIARNGAEAVRSAVALRPHIVLMDLGLPGIDGWDAIREIRDRVGVGPRPYGPHIIVLSSNVDADARRRAFEAGCNEYVVKPLDISGALRAYMMRRREHS
jgi:CheY-like chemotaxis protein